MEDFYNTDRMNPWWESLPYIEVFEYTHIFVLFYVVVAFCELISYYLTGFKNNGRFPIITSIPKKMLTTAFYFCIGVFFTFYFAMFWFILVWVILAAVLNPSKYLPYATAALTLFTTIGLKIVSYKLKYKNIFKKFEVIVTNRLIQAVD